MDLMRLAKHLGVVRSAPDMAGWGAAGVMPPPRVSDNGPLGLPAAFRAVQIIQTSIIQLTLDVWRTNPAGATTKLEGDSFPAILRRPDTDTTQTDLLTECAASLALRGNAYLLVAKAKDGRATGLRVLDPMECAPVRDATAGRRAVDWRGRTYGPSDLVHMRLLRVPADPYGVGPIQACHRALQGAIDMDNYGATFITDGGVPTGTLTTDQRLSQEQADAAKERWMTSVNAANGPAVLGSNLRYERLLLTPSEVQFLESRRFDVLSVARMFGIPAHLMLASLTGSAMTYQNVQDASTDFVRWTLMGYLRAIETGLSSVLPTTTECRFNVDALLRASTAARYSAYATGITAGVITPDEARADEGRPPLPDGYQPPSAAAQTPKPTDQESA